MDSAAVACQPPRCSRTSTPPERPHRPRPRRGNRARSSLTRSRPPPAIATSEEAVTHRSDGRQVDFETRQVRQYADEIANDERAHVDFLRAALGDAKVARPAIDLDEAFTAAARAAGLVRGDERFDAFANENNFLLGAFVFEDVGVTAYKGAAPLIANKTFLEAAAGILAVEAYHAGLIRTVLLAKGLAKEAGRISDARDSLDGPADLDQGIKVRGKANIVPTDDNGIAFSRTPGQVLNIVYLNPAAVTEGGFFPDGVNGEVNTSDSND